MSARLCRPGGDTLPVSPSRSSEAPLELKTPAGQDLAIRLSPQLFYVPLGGAERDSHSPINVLAGLTGMNYSAERPSFAGEASRFRLGGSKLLQLHVLM